MDFDVFKQPLAGSRKKGIVTGVNSPEYTREIAM